VQNLQLSGQDWPKTYLTGNQYLHGATLTFSLGTTPDTAWGSGPGAAPPSDPTGEAAVIPFLPASEVTVQPGQSATVALDARNITNRPVTATASAAPPAGITVSPNPAPIRLAAGGQGQVALTVTAGTGAAPGSYTVPITLSAGPAPPAQATVVVTVSAASAVSAAPKA
jgi:hypothetical protein